MHFYELKLPERRDARTPFKGRHAWEGVFEGLQQTESGNRDLNPGPHGPKPCALPNCAIPREMQWRRVYPKYSGRHFGDELPALVAAHEDVDDALGAGECRVAGAAEDDGDIAIETYIEIIDAQIVCIDGRNVFGQCALARTDPAVRLHGGKFIGGNAVESAVVVRRTGTQPRGLYFQDLAGSLIR